MKAILIAVLVAGITWHAFAQEPVPPPASGTNEFGLVEWMVVTASFALVCGGLYVIWQYADQHLGTNQPPPITPPETNAFAPLTLIKRKGVVGDEKVRVRIGSDVGSADQVWQFLVVKLSSTTAKVVCFSNDVQIAQQIVPIVEYRAVANFGHLLCETNRMQFFTLSE